MKTFRLIALLSLFPLFATAQEPSPSPSASPSIIPIWRCDLPGGTYEVALRAMLAVSTHEYIVDGVARVTEMNIDTPGDAEVRFYYIEPLTTTSPLGIGQATIDKAQEIAGEISQRATPGQPPWEKVVKNYPTTTHAHTVEYRLNSKDDIQTLFNSADQALRTGQNTEIRVQ